MIVPGIKVHVAADGPLHTNFHIMPYIVSRSPGGIPQAGTSETIFALSQIPESLFELNGPPLCRRHNHPPPWGTEVGSEKWAEGSSRHIFKSSSSEQSVEPFVLAIARFAVSAGVVVVSQESGRPGDIEHVPQIQMLKMSEMIRDPTGAGLPGTLKFVIHLALLGVFIEAKSNGGVRTMAGNGGHTLVIQAQVVGIQLEPGDMLALQVSSPKKRLVVLYVKVHVVPNDRFCKKRPESPGLALADLPMDPIERV